MMTSEKLERILYVCSSDENVKAEVIRNHDNNLWWPIDITDKRMRLLIAGLSTTIFYCLAGYLFYNVPGCEII